MGCFSSKDQAKEFQKQSKVNEKDKAIGQLKVTRDELRKKVINLENQVKASDIEARQCLREQKKEKALLILRKKKYISKTLDDLMKHQLNIDQMIVDIELAKNQAILYQALRIGTDALQSINKQLCLDDVEKLMEENQEAIEYQEEISRLLYGQGIGEDDEDILSQLEELDSAEALEVNLPSVPNHRVAREEVKAEKKRKMELA